MKYYFSPSTKTVYRKVYVSFLNEYEPREEFVQLLDRTGWENFLPQESHPLDIRPLVADDIPDIENELHRLLVIIDFV